MSDLRTKNWRELCEAASREHDPERLLELVTALNDVLERVEQEQKASRTRTQAGETLSRRHTCIVAAVAIRP